MPTSAIDLYEALGFLCIKDRWFEEAGKAPMFL